MCKFIANALGFRAPRMPEIKQPAPTAQAVNVTDDTTGRNGGRKQTQKTRVLVDAFHGDDSRQRGRKRQKNIGVNHGHDIGKKPDC